MVFHYCIVILKASSRRSHFDITFFKSRPGSLVVALKSFVEGVQVCLCLCVYKGDWGAVYFYLEHRSVSTSPPQPWGVEALTFSMGGINEPCDLQSGPLLLHHPLTHTNAHSVTHTCTSKDLLIQVIIGTCMDPGCYNAVHVLFAFSFSNTHA